MNIELIDTEPTRKGGEACDFVTVRVDGQEDQWEEAARLLGWRASTREPGVVRFLIERNPPYQPANPDRIIKLVTRQFETLTGRPPKAA